MDFKEPVNERAELSILGAMLNDEKALYTCVADIDEEHFTNDERRSIFTKILSLSDERRVSARILLNEVKDPKLKSMIRTSDSSYVDYHHFQHDLYQLKDTFVKRELFRIMMNGIKQTQGEESAEILADKLGERLSGLYVDDGKDYIIDPLERASEGLSEFIDGLSNPESNYGLRFSGKTNNGYIGFPSIDQSIMGAQKGDLIMVAAKTGEGKTALAINIARIFSLMQKHKGYYINTEMQKREMEARLLAPIAKMTAKELMFSQTDLPEEEAIRKVGDAYERYRTAHLYLSRIPYLTPQRVKGLARQVKMKYKGLDYIIIDYIQRMEYPDLKGSAEHEKLRKIAMRLKELAIELDIPVIILAQRNYEGFIEGSKSIRNECDAVFFFQSVNEDDQEHINNTFLNPRKRESVNYKIVKDKVRRDDNPFPIYCNFDKKKMLINEVSIG